MHMQYKADAEDALALPSFRGLYLLTLLVACLLLADGLFWWFGYETLRAPWGVSLALVAAILGGARIIYGALVALLEGDVGADLALAIALLAALALGEYWVGAEVVLIAMIGESLEALTFSRTHREIRRILELRPKVARVRREGQLLEIPIEQVTVGDLVVVRPGERIAVDGTVLTGRSAVDQSTLTGESLPIDKGEGDQVYAGTLNQFGAMELRADAVGSSTTLGQVIQLVAEAREHKGKTERIADRLARYFLPFVLACAAITFVFSNYGHLLGNQWPPLDQWVWMPTLAVLVVTCPCALILATPATIMAALAWLARRGVLTTGGAALERLAEVNRIAFDKTGTLTQGKLQLGRCLPLGDWTAAELLRLAATAEQHSEHLIARVLVEAAKEQQLKLEAVDDFRALPGAGVSCRLSAADDQQSVPSDAALLVGNRRLMNERGLSIPPRVDDLLNELEGEAQSPLLVALGDQLVGLIGVRDTVRPEAAEVVRQLHALGIEEIVLLTGDRRAAAAEVARAVGIDRFEAELRPAEKAAWLQQWRQQTREAAGPPLRVAMVGDGVNDAPALASADVGVALAGVGSDLAAEAGDLILLGDPLTPLPGLVRLSRETVRIIRQNIILFAFVVNFLGIVLTAWIMPSWSEAWLKRSPIAAALFHQAGSVLVLLNAMRLLWFERWQSGPLARLENALAHAVARIMAPLRPWATAGQLVWMLRGPLVRAAAALVIGLYLAQVVVFIQPDEIGVAKRFGRFHRLLEPGPHLRLPPPWDQIERQKPDRVRIVEIGLRSTANDALQLETVEWNSQHAQERSRRDEEEAIILTGDQSLVEIGVTIQYRVKDLRAYCFAARQPERMLHTLAESVLRDCIAQQPLLLEGQSAEQASELLTSGRRPLEQQVARQLQSRVDHLKLGIEIVTDGVCLQDVHPPLPVVAAFRDVSSAYKEKERMKNEAEADYRDKVIKAGGLQAWQELSATRNELTDELWQQIEPALGGEAAAVIAQAEAFSVQQQESALGESSRFLLGEAAHAQSPQLSSWRLLMESVEAALPGKNKLILDQKASGRRHLLMGYPQLPAILPQEPMIEPEH